MIVTVISPIILPGQTGKAGGQGIPDGRKRRNARGNIFNFLSFPSITMLFGTSYETIFPRKKIAENWENREKTPSEIMVIAIS